MITLNSPTRILSNNEWNELLRNEVCIEPNCKGQHLISTRSGIECQSCGMVYKPQPQVKKRTLSPLYRKNYYQDGKRHSYK